MRRWFFIVMLILLPVQLSWAAASAYCQHTAPHTTPHPGHHVHEHAQSPSGDSNTADTGTLENDCGVCNAGCSLALHTATPNATLGHGHLRASAPTPVPLRHYQDLPDRPQWATLA
jgi:hypothetical protein